MKRIVKILLLLCFAVLLAAGAACAPAEADNSVYTTLDDLEGKRIGVGTGSILDTVAREQWTDPQLMFYNNHADQILAVEQGKIDAFLTDQPVARKMASANKGLRIIEQQLMPDQYGFAFQKTEAGARLRDDFNAFMSNYDGGTLLEKLDGIWFGSDESAKVVDAAESLPATNGVIRFASTLEAVPFDYVKNEQPVGFELSLITMFCKEAGYGLRIEAAAFNALIPGLVTDKYDAIAASISITEERAKSVNFSEPFYHGGVVAVVYDSGAAAGEEKVGFFKSVADSFYKNFILENRWKMVVSGLGITLLLSVCSGIFGVVVGFGFCMMRRSRFKVLNTVSSVIIRVLQGTPIVVLLMIFYYIIFQKTGLNGITVAIVAFGLNFGAYTAEIMLSGINSVERGQFEAAAAIGFPPVQRFWKIIFPQAARLFLPVLKGEYISLVKMTSIVGYIAVQDLTKASDIIRSATFDAFFPLIATALIYFLLSFVLSSLLGLIEVKIDPKRRPRTLKGVEPK